MNDKLTLYMFLAATVYIAVVMAYCFILIWTKPVVDLTAPLLSIGTLLLGYYWGTSKSSSDKDKRSSP